MKTYELSYIISSQTTSEEADAVSKGVEFLIQNKGGVIFKSEKPVAKTLAYPIKKQSSGRFVFLEFQVGAESVKEIKEGTEKNENIIRCFIVIKDRIRELKKKRIRKTVSKIESYEEVSRAATGEILKEKEAIKTEDIDKKLEEILSE